MNADEAAAHDDAYAYTAAVLAADVDGVELAAAVLDHVCAWPTSEQRWAALVGVAQALAEHDAG